MEFFETPNSRSVCSKMCNNFLRDPFVSEIGDDGMKWTVDAVFSCDSRLLLTGSNDGKLRLWEIGSRKMLKKLDAHHRSITAFTLRDRSYSS